MKFMLRVDPHDLSADYAVLTLLGPQVPAGELRPAAIRLDTAFGTGLIVPRADLAAAVADLRAAGAIAAGRPRLGLDTDHRTIPHEVGWIDTAVHLSKGCYRGQETVARVHNLGRPPRRLVLLQLDGSEDKLPAHGDQVLLDGASVGFAGSAARHYELGPIALALVKRTTPVDATLQVDGIAAAQEVIVSPDAGANIQIELKRQRGGLMGRSRE